LPETMTAAAVSDGYTVQGASHHVCQDYASAGTPPGEDGDAWAVVSDGCSSAPDTDWGARLLARAAGAHVGSLVPECPGDPASWLAAAERYHDRVIGEAAAHARALGLTPPALTATLLTARTLGNRLVVAAYGDGVVALRERNTGRWRVLALSFADGKAAYPSYRLDPDTLALFRGLEANERRVAALTLPGGEGEGAAEAPPAALESDFLLWALPREAYDTVALLSDGATSFTKPPDGGNGGARSPVELYEVLPLLLDFRLMTCGFARRSLHSWQKASRKRGWEHYDDLSLAALYLPPVAENMG